MRILLMLLPLLFQYWEESAEIKSMRAHVEEICLAQNEGRAPGSEGEANVAAYVFDVLSASGAHMLCGRDGDIFGIRNEKGDTLCSRNVISCVQGYDKTLRDHFIVVGARMDSRGTNVLTVDGNRVEQIYTGANGNASGLSMLLELSGMIASNSLNIKRSVIFVAFGASSSSFAGAWHFLHHTFGGRMQNIDAMVNLDMLGIDKSGMMAFTAGNEDLNLMIRTVSQSIQPVKPALISEEPYPCDQQVFYAGEIPSVLFTSGRYSEHNTPKDTPGILDYAFMEREKEYIFNFIMELANAHEGVPSFRTVTRGDASDESIYAWSDCDVPPMFQNNPDPTVFLQKWVYPYLKYPESCIRDGVQGRVMVEFIIQADGTLTDAHVTRGIDPELDEAALKVIKISPKWRPARMGKKKVACSMAIPVEFRLKKTR